VLSDRVLGHEAGSKELRNQVGYLTHALIAAVAGSRTGISSIGTGGRFAISM